jgi:predicted nucleic acid-binding protein
LTYVLDAWAVVSLLQAEQPAVGEVRALLESAAAGEADVAMSQVNLGEVYYIVARRRGQPAADDILERLRRLPIVLIAATDERVLAAARFKAGHRVSYADAFAAAAALELGAQLVTGDSELVALAETLPVRPLRRRS